jgi:hypothetical protein
VRQSDKNSVRQAEDAFGTSVGRGKIGLYSPVRTLVDLGGR